MMMLLPLLAMLPQASDPPRQCSIERKTQRAGTLYASRIFPGDHRVRQVWLYLQEQVLMRLYWASPLPAAPDDAARLQIELRNIPRDADKARVELWRDGKRISERVGYWNDLRGAYYRSVTLELPVGEVRALLAAGPIQLVAANGDGKMVSQVQLSRALIRQPGVLAQSARRDFAALAADYGARCPLYSTPGIGT